MLASVPVSQVAEILQDTLKTSFTSAQLVAWWNDAQRVIAIARPDLVVVTEPFLLGKSTVRQVAPSGTNKIIDITKNLGIDGGTHGKAIRLIDRASLDEYDDRWTIGNGATIIKEWAYDERNPRVFYVYPKPNATTDVYVELIRSSTPVDCVDENSEINVPNICVPAGVSWMLYRCFSRDSEETPNYARAQGFKTECFELLGVKSASDKQMSPKNREAIK